MSYVSDSWHKKYNIMIFKSFIYNGLKITPLRNLTPAEKKKGLKITLSSIGISNYQESIETRKYDVHYDYDDFYIKAKSVGAMGIDVFKYKDFEVIPCNNELFRLG